MPRHALRSELAAKLSDGWTGAAGRHVLSSEMPSSGAAGRHALTSEVDALVVGPPPTTPTFHGVAQNRGFATTNVVGAVTGTQVGDVLLAFAAGNDQTTGITPPAGLGWTQIGDTAGAAAGRMYVFATTATAANQAGGTWTWGGSHNHSVSVLAYAGATKPTAAATARAAVSATTVDAPTVTSIAAGAMLIAYAFFATNGSAPAWPGTMTVRSPSLNATASGVGAEESRPTPGATGTRTFTAGATAPSAMTAAALILEPA